MGSTDLNKKIIGTYHAEKVFIENANSVFFFFFFSG